MVSKKTQVQRKIDTLNEALKAKNKMLIKYLRRD